MPKFIVYTDLQAAEGHEHCFSQPELPLQRWRVDKFIADVDQLCRKYGVDHLIDLGDTSDDRTSLQIPTIAQIAKLGSDSRGFIKLIGNHEQYRRDQKIHTGDLYGLWNVVSTRQTFEVGGCKIIATAYTEDLTELNDWLLKELLRSPKDMPIVILGHWDVAGAKTSNGMQLSGIPITTLNKAQLTLLGHIHKPQKLGEAAYYVGSPFQQDYGEAGEQKRVGVLTLEDGTITFNWHYLMDRGYPEYRRVTFKEYAKQAPAQEDRYTVLLENPEEAAQFAALPWKGQATPQLGYGETMALQTRTAVSKLILTPKELLTTYLNRRKLHLQDIMSEEDLVTAGLELYEAT